eukprot:SAG11_NODE_317_length_10836_cov_7.445469_9_plen_175_part_00
MWKNGSTYFASFDQNCGFCPAGSGAWIHSASHPLGPWKLHININRKLLPGCEPSSRPAAANGECGRGGYQYGARPAPPQTQTGGEECWQHLAGNYRGSVGPGMGGDDAIVITAEKAATATEAQYVATGTLAKTSGCAPRSWSLALIFLAGVPSVSGRRGRLQMGAGRQALLHGI